MRESDGLAVSSRNVHLNAEQRRWAPALYAALTAARELVAGGERDAAAVRRRGLEVLARQPEIRVEYLEVVDAEQMQPIESVQGRVRIAAAVWVGSTRLIDNVLAEV